MTSVSLTYLSVDEIVMKVWNYGRDTLMAKFDIKLAYRNVLVHLDDR